jgi:hypothetical protein
MEHGIRVGSLASARRASAVCEPGESGVCYEVYELEGRPGYGFIFERGRYDGFSPDEVGTFLQVSGRVSKDVAGYEFRNVGQLDRDYRAGRFASAFEEQNRIWEDAAMEEAAERSGLPHPRDLLRRDMLEEAKGRPRDTALEKHGADIEADLLRELDRERETERRSRRLTGPERFRERHGPDVDMDR